MEFERGVKRCLDSSPRGLDSSPQCLETALSPRANLEAEVEPTVPPKGPRTSRGDLSHRFATKAEFTSLREQLHNLEARLDSMNWNLVGGQGQARDAPEPAKPVSNVTESEEAPSEAEAKEATVSFSESIWDTAILIGMPPIGEAGSFLLGLGLVLNILIQAIFILIIYENLAQKVFSEEDLAGLSAFRHKIAHDARFVSEASGVSLADRVCNEDLTLEMATTQVTRLAEIKAYLGEEGSLTQFLNGPLMCQLALAVWIMCILKEVSASWNIFSALRRLPSHAGRGSQVTKKGDEGCKLLHLSRARKLFALLICMLRLTVAIVLLWIGTQYLCYTTSIGDLLLNAIALEVVINIDDMVFSAMAPVSAVEVVAELAPLPLPSWPRWRGADMGALATPVILVGLMVLCGFTSLADTIHNLQDAQERLCGQNTHFMYQFDGLRMARVQPLAPFNIDEAYNIDGIASLAVKEVKSDLPHSQWQYALLSDSTSSQRFMDQASESAMMATVRDIYRSRQRIDELVSQCHDAFDRIESLEDMPLLSNQWGAWPGYLGRALGLSEPVTSCKQVRGHCFYASQQSHLAMAMIRALCPVTCGCNSLLNGTIFTSASMGCPEVCLSSVSTLERDTTPCDDVDPATESDPRLEKILAFFNETRLAHPNTSVARADELFDGYGCSVAHEGVDMCVPSGTNLLTQLTSVGALPTEFTKIMTMMCPKTCNCDGKRTGYNQRPPKEACPTACICDWTLQPAIADSAWEDRCIVINPYPFFVEGLPPVPPANISIDSQCCHLMNKFLYLILVSRGGHQTLLNTVQRRELLEADQHLCNPCRRDCYDTLVRVVANFTFRTPQATEGDFCQTDD